jgi:hypothetical protein
MLLKVIGSYHQLLSKNDAPQTPNEARLFHLMLSPIMDRPFWLQAAARMIYLNCIFSLHAPSGEKIGYICPQKCHFLSN